MTVYNDLIDTSLPDGGDDPAEADNNIRRIQKGFQEILAVEHNVDLTGTIITGDGKHTDITTLSIVNAGALANAGNLTINTNKFTIDAATGNVVVAGTLDVAGAVEITGVATLGDASLLKTSAAPSTDAMIANKKYVDDQIDAVAGHDGDGYAYFDVDGSKTKVYTKYFTGTLDGDSSTSVAHGITGVDNILSVSVSCYNSNTSKYNSQEVYRGGASTYAFEVSYNATNITIGNVGSYLRSQKYRIKIDYK